MNDRQATALVLGLHALPKTSGPETEPDEQEGKGHA